MSVGEVLIDVENVSKKFCRDLKKSLWYGAKDTFRDLFQVRKRSEEVELRDGEFWANKDISFQVRRGECLGLVGRNGAGKTTLLKMLCGLIMPDIGNISVIGRTGSIIALGAGFNPVLTGRENVYVNGSVLGLSRADIRRSFDEIVDFAELSEFIDVPVQSYSSGMRVRLGFAVATSLRPDVLILDEVLAVGDISFRQKCYQRIGALLKQAAVILVSHDMAQLNRLCDNLVYLDRGNVEMYDSAPVVIDSYLSAMDSGCETPPTIVKCPEISALEFELSRREIRYGESFEACLKIESSLDLPVGLALFAIHSHGSSCAQSDVTALLPAIKKGRCEYKIQLEGLALASGKYSVSITILDESRKGTLLHGTNLTTFCMSGKRGFGVPYQINISN